MAHILIVEDEKAIADLIDMTLSRAGYRCEMAHDGLAAADLIEKNSYDLALFDIMLPGADGYELLEYIKPSGTPVIFLTAKSALKERVKGLKLGADDYIVKPFEPPELVARVETVLRHFGKSSGVLTAFGVSLDPLGHRVTNNRQPVSFTPREFDLLEILMRNQGVALYRDVLFERAWGGDPEDGTRTLDLHILRLRKKLGWQNEIRTVFKVGYMLEKQE